MLYAGAAASCSTPSSEVDAGDVMGVFDRDGGPSDAGIVAIAQPSASARRSKDAGVTLAPVERPAPPEGQTCVAARGAPMDPPKRVMGRPACRGFEVTEWRAPDGSPRYACTFVPPDIDKRGPLPLVVFFHGDTPGLDDPSSLGRLTNLREHANKFDLGAGRPGFILVAIQGRALSRKGGAGASFDTDYTEPDNLDWLATDHFVDALVARNIVDRSRVYSVGSGWGGAMAVTYAMLDAHRIAAFAAFAPEPPTAEWTCPGPPPPGIVLYKSCDAITSCSEVESWLLSREKTRAETTAMRLSDTGLGEPNCAIGPACGKKRGENNHALWPKTREKDVLKFLAAHSLSVSDEPK
ncbi:MAG: hypothetical protein U0414_28365 [Polyangiaceae bacterium]